MTRLRGRLVFAGRLALGAGLALITADRANPPDLTRANSLSPEVVADDGTLLRAFLSKDGAWRIHTNASQVGSRYLTMLKAYEDQRFDSHFGVDPAALLRAAVQFVSAGHVVSGGSTLTMQVARLLEPDIFRHHNVTAKFLQILRAVQLEERYSKDRILSLYLTLAPMGGNLEGVRAASLSYFGKEPASLDLAQSALLVALPQSPTRQRPDRHAQAALAGRDHVLARMVEEGVVTPGDAAAARREGVPFARQPMPLNAPHLAQHLVLAYPAKTALKTTINANIQTAAERLARQERAYLDDGGDVALVVVENRTRNVVAYVGGTNYWGPSGQVDLANRARSPGSALKPFIYGMAFDELILHPQSRMEDQPTSFGDYAPRDFDGQFQGAVTARDALQMSLNIPAVMVLDRVGPLAFTLALRNAGAHLAFDGAPSLPVALGGLGVPLRDVAMLYAGIAEGGTARGLNYLQGSPPKTAHRLFGPVAAWYLRDILDGVSLPDGWAMGQGLNRRRTIGFKTGTSYGFRDAWSVGFSNDYTVAVWVGRADGTPRAGHVGRDSAAPILLKMFGLLPPDRRPAPPMPKDAITARNTSDLPPSLRVFSRQSTAPAPVQRVAQLPPPSIAWPPNGAVVPLPNSHARDSALQFKADGGKAPLTWLVNGALLGSFDRFAPALYTPAGEGLARVTVVDAEGRSDTSEIRFKKMR
ncbi:MAG: penicillin-binding protein 1C [Alphaproteobacteria bacterium]|nr:penicillin-binding protein 1C [Alphaproteobacteria bacterium]